MHNAKDFKTLGPCQKLNHKMHSRFTITRVIGSHAYKLEFLPKVGKHPVFDVSMTESYNVNQILGTRSPMSPP